MEEKISKKQEDYRIEGMPVGMCFGVAVGILVGVLTDNLAICMCFGMSIGLITGMGIGSMIRKQKLPYKNEETEACEKKS